MSTNLDRLRKDLSELIDQTMPLYFSAFRVADKTAFDKQIDATFKSDSDKISEFIKELPAFGRAYQAWYSESMAILEQILPSRAIDFREHYEVPKNRKELNNLTYRIHDLMGGLSREYAGVHMTAALSHIEAQINILKAAERRFESSLFEIRQIVQADLFDNELDAASELLRNKFTRAAGAVAGVVLERHLKQVCSDHGIKITKAKLTISILNDALKDAATIDVPRWRFIQHLGDIRNACDHARTPEPTNDQVQDLITGTQKIIKTVV